DLCRYNALVSFSPIGEKQETFRILLDVSRDSVRDVPSDHDVTIRQLLSRHLGADFFARSDEDQLESVRQRSVLSAQFFDGAHNGGDIVESSRCAASVHELASSRIDARTQFLPIKGS